MDAVENPGVTQDVAPEDVWARVAMSVVSWDQEVSDVFSDLTVQLTQMEGRLSALLADRARRRDEGVALVEAQASIEGLTRDVAQRDADLGAATRHIAQLKEECAVVVSGAEALRVHAEQGAVVERGLLEELDSLRGELAEAREQVAAARFLAGTVEEMRASLENEQSCRRALEAELSQKAGEADSLNRQLGIVLEEREEAHQTIRALHAETEMLRRANASLTAVGDPRAGEDDAPHTESALGGSVGHKRRMGEMLLNLGLIKQEDLAQALGEQASAPQRRIGAILVEKGYATEEVVAQILAGQLGLPFVRLAPDAVEPGAPRLINGQTAKRRQCVPIAASPQHVVLAMANPLDLIAIDDVELTTGCRVDPVVATASDVAAAVARYYGV